MISHKLTDLEEACCRKVAGLPDAKRREQIEFWASLRKTVMTLKHEALEAFEEAKQAGKHPHVEEYITDCDLNIAARCAAMIIRTRQLGASR